MLFRTDVLSPSLKLLMLLLLLLADRDVAQKRTVPFFAWSLLESVGLTDVQLHPNSKGKTLKRHW